MSKPRAGSSPRGRGKRTRVGDQGSDDRLIPAWAGKTTHPVTRQDRGRAHPRVGGENVASKDWPLIVAGSSPRGRGKRRRFQLEGWLPGLIPAWAGKTRTRSAPGPSSRAHPRVGGENSVIVYSTPGSTGSSPRGRGKRYGNRALYRVCRLIPAWAGKTRTRNEPARCSRAHPRVGGENRP